MDERDQMTRPVPQLADPLGSCLDLFAEEFGCEVSAESVTKLAAVYQAARCVINEAPTGFHRHREEQQRIYEAACRELAEAVDALDGLQRPDPHERVREAMAAGELHELERTMDAEELQQQAANAALKRQDKAMTSNEPAQAPPAGPS